MTWQRFARLLFDPRTIDPSTIYTNTREFHTLMLKAAQNPLLEILAEPVFRVLQRRFAREQAPGRL